MKWQPYPGYKPSGVEWLGEVPEKWEMKPLKRIFITLNGSTPKSGEPNYWDGDIPWATPDDLGSLIGDTLNITRRMITQEGYESCGTSLAPAGTLVLSTRAPIGHLAIAGVPMCANQGCRCLVFRGKVENRFYYYQLLTAKQELESWGQGSTFKELNRDRLTAVYLVSPPFDEQCAIAAFLDRETGRIDALVEKKRRQIELLQEKRAALISHAVTKGLDPTAPMKESGIEFLGKIPAHWQVLPIKRVARMDSGHTPDKKVEEYWTDCTIPWVSLNDTAYLKDNDYIDDTAFHVNELGLANSSAHLLPARVVLFTRDATIGLSAITTRPMAVSQHIITWICGPRMVPEYLLRVFYAMKQELERLCMGSTIRTLGMPDVLELVTPLPPVEEQHRIIKRLEDEVPKLVALVGKVEESIRILLEHRTALISAAVTGKIDVRGEVGIARTQRKAPAAFQRVVLAAEILDRLHNDPNFGRVKFEKTLYLCEHHLGMDLQGNYWRQAAGPLDNRMLYSLENQMQRQKWFGTRRDGQKITYVPMEKAGGHRKYFDDCWADYREGLDSLLEVVQPLNTERSEIVATLFAAWNDLIIAGAPFNEEDILREVRHNWHESKERFDEDRLHRALQWMRDKGLVPQGLGRATRTER